MSVVELVLSIVVAAFASTGFWSLIMYKIQKRDKRKDAMTRLMIGLAHDRIMTLGDKYVTQGYISEDDYDDFMKYLYDPYIELGGNGTAEKFVENQVKQLKIVVERGN